MKRALTLIVAASLVACASPRNYPPDAGPQPAQGALGTSSLVQGALMDLGGSLILSAAPRSTTVAGITAASVLYQIYDPLAPNWTIREQLVALETYRLSLRAKNFRVGGDGESMNIIRRRAEQLQHEHGYIGYRLISYTEGIESATPFSYRVSEGTIQMIKAPPSPTPPQAVVKPVVRPAPAPSTAKPKPRPKPRPKPSLPPCKA